MAPTSKTSPTSPNFADKHGPDQMLQFRQTARKIQRAVLDGPAGQPEASLRIMDETVRSMSVGGQKQALIDQLLDAARPEVCVELGAYAGYSATATALRLPPGGHLYSIEFDSEFAGIVRSVLEHCGLSHKVTVLEGSAEAVLPELRERLGPAAVQFLFIDHDKAHYVADLELCEPLLAAGATVVADNILFPGAPEYVEFMNQNEHKYESELKTGFKLGSGKEDALMVSVFKG